MANSPNKGYILQGVGDNAGSWGTVLNDNMISYVDLNLGGIVTKSLSSSNVTLSASESRHAILRLTGTLLANVIVTTECLGFFFVENLTTGSFTVTIKNSSTATSVTIPQSTRATLIGCIKRRSHCFVGRRLCCGNINAVPSGRRSYWLDKIYNARQQGSSYRQRNRWCFWRYNGIYICVYHSNVG